MVSLLNIPPPALQRQPDLLSLSQIGSLIQSSRANAMRRQQLQQQAQLAPLRERLLQAQAGTAEFGAAHPMIGKPGIAGQAAALSAVTGRPLDKIMQSMSDTAQASQKATGAYHANMAKHAGTRYSLPADKLNTGIALHKLGYSSADITPLGDEEKAHIISTGTRHPDVSPERRQMIENESNTLKSARARIKMTTKQLDAQRLIAPTMSGVNDLLGFGRKFGSYMGIGGKARLLQDKGRLQLTGKSSPEYKAWLNYNAKKGSVIDEIRRVYGGPASDFALKVLNPLLPQNLGNITPAGFESIIQNLIKSLRTQGNFLGRDIAQNLQGGGLGGMQAQPERAGLPAQGGIERQPGPLPASVQTKKQFYAWVKNNPEAARRLRTR